MGDRVEERAAALLAVANKATAETQILNAACAEALKDVGESFQAALAGHTKYRVLTVLDEEEWCLRNSYFKEMLGNIAERGLLEIRINRSELALNKRRMFKIKVPGDAPLVASKRPPDDDLLAAEAISFAVEIAIESMAASIASGCVVLDPDEALARMRFKRK